MNELISRISIGVLLAAVVVLAQRRPPNYSQDRMPVTSFSCRDKIIGGYYADPETDCQMFHVCVKVPGQGIQDYKFLCPNDTSFDQENQICDDWFNIDCEASTLYYSDNFDLYRLGSDFPGSNQNLPSNSINNAVSEVDDPYYLQKSDRGESAGADLLRGSHSSNFYSNKNRGREDDDDVKDEYKKKTPSKGNVKKLLTGKRLHATTQAPVVSSTGPEYQPRLHNNNYSSGRVSQFRGHARGQQQSTAAPSPAPKNTEPAYNRQPQRQYYSPTTPAIVATAATSSPAQRTDFYRNYNPTTTSANSQRTDYRNYNPTTSSPTQRTDFYRNYNPTTGAATDFFRNYNPTTKRNPPYESDQTGSTAAPTTRNYYTPRVTTTSTQATTFADTTPSSERNNYYETQRLYQLNTASFNQYEEPKDEFLKTAPSQNLGASAFNSLQNSYKSKSFNTSVSTSFNFNPTQKPTTNYYQTQTYFTQSTQQPNYNSQTTVKPFQNNYYTTPKVQQNTAVQYTPTTLRPYQQQNSVSSTQTPFQDYNPTTLRSYYQQQYTPSTPKPFQQQSTAFQSARNSATPQQTNQSGRRNQGQQRNPPQYQQTSNYYSPTTQRAYQTTLTNSKVTVADPTEQPRPFAQGAGKKDDKKEKEQYDYAYYDDAAQSEYDNIEPLEEFKRTKTRN